MGSIGADPVFEAACRCGRCRYRCTGAPLQVSYCHCVDCRRANGAPVSVFAGFADTQVERLGAAPAVYRPAAVERSFCPNCGTPLTYADPALPGELYFHIGAFAEPEAFLPQKHAFADRALSWLALDDELPRHAGVSRPR